MTPLEIMKWCSAGLFCVLMIAWAFVAIRDAVRDR